jgi:hypothetical protein
VAATLNDLARTEGTSADALPLIGSERVYA